MNNERAIAELNQIYGILSPEKQMAIDKAVEALTNQKAEKTGHWIKDGRVDCDGNICVYCSNCKRGDVHAKGQKVPFCWWCGARMEEENE